MSPRDAHRLVGHSSPQPEAGSSAAVAAPFVAGHTPGPWSIHTEYEAPYRHVVMNDELQQRVCLVPQYAEVDHIANARLIAAAPTMQAEIDRLRFALRAVRASTDPRWQAQIISDALRETP